MHLILLLRNIDFIIWIWDSWADFTLDLVQAFLILDHFLLFLVELSLDFFDFIKFLRNLFLHLLNISFQIFDFLDKFKLTSPVLFSVFSKALKLLRRISYSALAWAMVFWDLSPRLTVKLGPVGSWFDI